MQSLLYQDCLGWKPNSPNMNNVPDSIVELHYIRQKLLINEHEKFMVKYGWLLLLLFSWVATTWTLSHQWLHFTILLISLADLSRNRSFLQWDDRLRSIPIFFLRFIDCILLMINGRKRPLTPLSSYLSLVKLNTSEIIQVKKEKVILMAQSDR